MRAFAVVAALTLVSGLALADEQRREPGTPFATWQIVNGAKQCQGYECPGWNGKTDREDGRTYFGDERSTKNAKRFYGQGNTNGQGSVDK